MRKFMPLNATIMFLNVTVMAGPLVYLLGVAMITWLFGITFRIEHVRQYGKWLMIGVDQAANTVLMGFPDETISSRTGRAIVSGRPKWYAKVWHKILDGVSSMFGIHNHSVDSIEIGENFDKRDDELWRWSHKN